jgi:hypothetical protein
MLATLPKPFRPPILKPRRLLKEIAVTIAVGFQCREGIVLCADSQETISGYIKLDQRKVRLQLSAPNRAVAIEGAGAFQSALQSLCLLYPLFPCIL